MGKRLMVVLIFMISAATLVTVVYLVIAGGGRTVPGPHTFANSVDVTTRLTPVKRTQLVKDREAPAQDVGVTPAFEAENQYELDAE